MNIANPQYLYLLLLLPAIALLGIYSFARKKTDLKRFVSETMQPHVVLGRSNLKSAVKFGLFLTGILMLVISLLGPRWGFHWEEIKRQGVDIVVALDTSDSMLSRDVDPSRLERAKREVYDLIGMLKGDRVGLVVFSGGAFLQCPLTLDYSACMMLLDYADTTVVSHKGTNLAEAIRKSVAAFDISERSAKAIILISDGGDLAGDPMAAAAEAKEEGIKIFAIGVGREDEEVPIPLPMGTLKYSEGKMVTTSLEDKVLKDIALATGGSYVRSVTGDLDLEKIYYEKIHSKMEKREFQSMRQKRWEERFQWPLLLAAALLFAEAIIGERRRDVQA
jgi:Ca-activated chloride channel family protein